MPRLRIGGKVYATDSLNDISLANLLIFKSQAHPYTWADVQRLAAELDEMDEDEAGAAFEREPEYMLPLGVMVWLARKAAGEEPDFWKAIDIPATAVSFVPEPGDKKPGKASKGAKKSPKNSPPKSSASTASAQADEPRPHSVPSSTSTDSSETSGAA